MGDSDAERNGAGLTEQDLAALRRTVRKRVLWAAHLMVANRRFDCVVVDLSLGGARLHYSEPVSKGEQVTLVLERIGSLEAEVVWQEERSIGLRFTDEPQRISELIGGRLPLTPAMPKAATG